MASFRASRDEPRGAVAGDQGDTASLDLLRLFDAIVAEHIPDFIEIGVVRYAKTPHPYKERRSLSVQPVWADFEIILWDSGEVEFGYGTEGEAHEQTLMVTCEADLRELVGRFIQVARSWKPSRLPG